MGESLNIVLSDRQPLFLEALRASLASRGHRVLATSTTRRELLDDVQRDQPDLCVIDSDFADGDGIEAITEIAARSPSSRVVVLTADGREALMRRALDAGAHGFVHKSHGLAAVLRTLENVVVGNVSALMAVQAHARRANRAPHQTRQLAAFLTPREIECLGLVAAGLDTLHIAHRLGVSPATVRSHVQAVLTKLGVRTRLEAATLAIRHGLIRRDDESQLARWA